MYGNPELGIKPMKKAFLACGRQQGKDTVCGIFIFRKALEVPGNYFYIFPESSMARRAFWEKVDPTTGMRLIDQLPNHPEVVEGINNQEMVIRLRNKSTIRILGLDQSPERARGISPAGVVFSEVAFIDPDVLASIEPAIQMNDAWVVYNTTPNGRNHAWRLFNYATQHTEIFYSDTVQSYSKDLPGYFPHDQLNEQYFNQLIESGQMTEEQVAQEYGVSWFAELRGSFYSDQINKARAEGRIANYPYNNNYPVSTYWDLGYDDSTAVWFKQTIGGREVFIDYMEYSNRDLLEDVLDLKDRGYYYDKHVVPHDAKQHSKQTGITTYEMLENLLLEYNVSGYVQVLEKTSVQAGITAVRRRFSTYFFNEDKCGAAVEKLEMYHRKYDKLKGIFLKDPVHDAASHCADALRSEACAELLSVDPFYSMNQIEVIKDFDPFGRDK